MQLYICISQYYFKIEVVSRANSRAFILNLFYLGA